MVTSRNFSEIWIIDHNTTTEETAGEAGDLLYRWGNPQTYGLGTEDDRQLFGPHDGQWIAKGLSGAQRLSNGNTLICEGTEGRFFEVTSVGDIEWEYSNPYTTTNLKGDTINQVFRVTRYDLDNLGEKVTIETDVKNINIVPTDFSLGQNYPNPFNPTTTIQFALSDPAKVQLIIYNIMGEHVRTLISKTHAAGTFNITWDGTNDKGMLVSSGIYIYQIKAGNNIAVKKMSFMK